VLLPIGIRLRWFYRLLAPERRQNVARGVSPPL
jgi:hypothetical protein